MIRNAGTSDILINFAAQPWAMEPGRLQAFFTRLGQIAPQAEAIARIRIERSPLQLNVRDGVAVIPVRGILLETVPDWMVFFGIEAMAYGDIARLVGEAVAAPQVTSLRLEVDSPGGTVAGVLDAARAIRAARDAKPVAVQSGSLVASAAYWLASQANTIAADLNAEIGSIGVYTVYEDYSSMAEKLGIKVCVIASGEHKGMGVPGAPITEGQIAAVREVIDAMADNFVAAVADGRKLSTDVVRALATGRLWEAKAALPLQLIDTLGAPATAASVTASTSAQGDQSMSDKENQAAGVDVERTRAQAHQAGQDAERKRLGEFKAAFPEDLEFALTSFESGMSVEQAKAAYGVVQKRTKAPAATGADGRIGTAEGEGNQGAPPAADFMAASRAYAKEHGCSMVVAMQAVRRENRTLHDQWFAGQMAKARPVRGSLERVSV